MPIMFYRKIFEGIFVLLTPKLPRKTIEILVIS